MTTYKNWTRIKWDGNPDLGYECWRKTFGKGYVSVGIGEFRNVVFSFGANSDQSHSCTRWNYDQPPLSEVQVMLQLDMMWELKGRADQWRFQLPPSIYQRDLSRPYILGDYVLATKYENGRASDPWVLGFYAGGTPGGRWFKIVDDNLQPLNQEGFQRMERVHPEVGATLLKEVAALRATPGLDIWKMTAELEKQRQAISKLNQDMKVSPPAYDESEPTPASVEKNYAINEVPQAHREAVQRIIWKPAFLARLLQDEAERLFSCAQTPNLSPLDASDIAGRPVLKQDIYAASAKRCYDAVEALSQPLAALTWLARNAREGVKVPVAPAEPVASFEPVPLAEIVRMATTHEGFRLEVSQGTILALGCILPWTEIKVGQMWASVIGPPVRVTNVTEKEVRYEWFTPRDSEEPKSWDKDPFSFQARYSLVLAEAGDTSFSVCVTRSSEQISVKS